MADIETSTTCEEGYKSVSRVGDFRLTVDATSEDGPEPNSVLVANYASCYLPALRVGGQQNGEDDLGKMTIEAEADLDDDDDLTGIHFNLKLEADIDEETAEAIVADGKDICHVHSAVREGLQADVDVETDAF
ncbi:MAG: OsmC family protein [Haloarculaceae archaeon]